MNREIAGELRQLNMHIQRWDQVYHRFALNANISDAQFFLLYTVCESKTPITQHEVGQNWSCPKQTINSAISSLVKMGLVFLESLKGAKNSKAVCLTEAGEMFCKKYIRPAIDADILSFASLACEERKMLISLLDKQATIFEAQADKLLSNK